MESEPQHPMAAGSTAISLSIHCTDKGQHRWKELGDLSIYIVDREDPHYASAGEPFVYANVGWARDGVARRREDECVSIDAHKRVVIRCPSCGRHVEWRLQRAREVVHSLGSSDASIRPRLDLSQVP